MSEQLVGGRFAGAERVGDTVLRRPGRNSANVLALLRHFRDHGLALAPDPRGHAPDGREVLGHLAGAAVLPPLPEEVRSDAALVSAARAVRALHDASVDFAPPEPWRPARYEVVDPDHLDIVGHGDLAPWNLIFVGPAVVGVIDWDTAGPSSRAWDLSYLAHQLAPFHPTDDLAGWGWDVEPDRAARLRLLCSTYGGVDPAELVDLAAIRLAATAAFMDRRIAAGDPAFDVQRHEDHPAGYRRAAGWILTHRADLLGA